LENAEIQDVGNVGASPLVDRLIFVADNADVLLFLSQEANQSKLKRVCILVLVNEDVAKLVVVFIPDFTGRRAATNCPDHEVIESSALLVCSRSS
jgi:hypothetical protein